MFEKTHFMKTQDLLHRGMNASVTRRKVLSDNIANVDVPHFKRSELVFESMIQRALESEKIEYPKKGEIKNSLLIETFPEQTNTVYLTIKENKTTYTFNKNKVSESHEIIN